MEELLQQLTREQAKALNRKILKWFEPTAIRYLSGRETFAPDSFRFHRVVCRLDQLTQVEKQFLRSGFDKLPEVAIVTALKVVRSRDLWVDFYDAWEEVSNRNGDNCDPPPFLLAPFSTEHNDDARIFLSRNRDVLALLMENPVSLPNCAWKLSKESRDALLRFLVENYSAALRRCPVLGMNSENLEHLWGTFQRNPKEAAHRLLRLLEVGPPRDRAHVAHFIAERDPPLYRLLANSFS